jgi:nucleotide-binding universal stress UspA family protein
MSAILEILVGTDFSATAGIAVQRGLRLAAMHGAALRLVHARHDAGSSAARQSPASADPAADASDEERCRQRLANLAAALVDQAGIDVTIHVESGPPARVINAQAKEIGCSLVVVGSRADATIAGLGSTAADVVRAPTCPVLTVRASGSGSYERVVVATDLGEGAARAASFALQLFPSARHHLLHALDRPSPVELPMQDPTPEELGQLQQKRYRAAKAGLRALARQLSARTLHPVVTDVAEDVPGRAVLVYAADLPADCVVVGHHAGAPDPELILGSLAQHVIYSSICDVLVVP